jgi:hypothetical protein
MTVLHSSLIRQIERTIQSPIENFSSAIFPGPEMEWPRQGRHFSLQKDGASTIIYPWFGLYDTALGPVIYIGFNGETGWCKPVFDAVLAKELTEGSTYRIPYKDLLRQELCFALKEEQHSRIKSAISDQGREMILLDFFSEVISHVGQYLL